MRYILSSSRRLACPSCGSSHIARSHMKGIYEHLLQSVFQVKPYRCMSCDYRHFRYRPSSVHGADALTSKTGGPSVLPSSTHNGTAVPSASK